MTLSKAIKGGSAALLSLLSYCGKINDQAVTLAGKPYPKRSIQLLGFRGSELHRDNVLRADFVALSNQQTDAYDAADFNLFTDWLED